VASASVYVLGQMYESYAEETESSIPESAEAETTYETKEEKNFRATFIEKSQKQKNERPQIKEAATIISETNQIFHSAVINGIESSEHIPAFYVDERKGVTTFENITKQPICGGKVPRTITFHEEVTQLYTNQLNFNRDMNYGLINIFTWDRKICDIDFEMDIIHEGHTYIVKENKNYQVIKSTEGYTFNLNKQNYRQENNIYTLAFCDHSLNNCILRNFKIDIWEDSDNSFIDFKYEQANNISDLFNIEQIIENKSFWLVSKGSQNLGFVYFRGEHEMHLYIDERYNRTLFVKNKTKYDAALTIMSVLSCENVSYLDALKYSRSIEPLIWC
jgi:hypothetical protein